MADVSFKIDFDYRVPGKQSTIAYKAGWSGKVPASHARAAEKADALEMPEKSRGDGAGGNA